MAKLDLNRVGMPKQATDERRLNFNEVALGYSAEEAAREASRCIDCKARNCVAGCPVAIDIPDFIRALKNNDLPDAARILKRTNALPGICGRVCPQESQCEAVCTLAKKGAAVAIGSRAKAAPDTAVEARWYRKLPGRLLNWSINMFLVPGIADTQCGFKAFEAAAARQLFTQQQNERWSFDFELLYLARRAGLTIAEVPVNWRHVSGSKVNVLADGLRMLLDIAIIRWRHRGLGPGPS